MDGTLIEAWASMKSFRPKDGGAEPPVPGRNGERQFHGEKRTNETHASTTDPDARLYKKSCRASATLCYMEHVVIENRNGLVVATELTRRPAPASARQPSRWSRICLASAHHAGRRQGLRHGGLCRRDAPAGRDAACHANTKGRRSAIDGRTTRHLGYASVARSDRRPRGAP